MSKMIYPTTNLTATEQLIIARERGYHGVTVAVAALTGLPANKPTRQAFSNNAVALFCQRACEERGLIVRAPGGNRSHAATRKSARSRCPAWSDYSGQPFSVRV